jgi:uncharacterized membrane protein YbhN (UPF0104 family)
MIAAICFIVYLFRKQQIDFSVLNSGKIIAGLTFAAVVYAFNIVFGSFCYCYILAILSGKRLNRPRVMRAYCEANIYRYIPGNVMHYIGRNRIAANEDIAYANVNIASLVEIIALSLSAVILSLLSVNSIAVDYLKNISLETKHIVFVAAALLVIAVVVLFFRKKLRRFARDFKDKILNVTVRQGAIFCGGTCVRLVVNALIYLFCLSLLGVTDMGEFAVTIAGLFILSWLIGFITPGAPGGLGIREAMMVMFLNHVVNDDVLFISAVAFRLICVAGDIMAWLGTWLTGRGSEPMSFS